MDTVMTMGYVVGAIFGPVHAVYVYRSLVTDGLARAEGHAVRSRLKAIYYAIWTLAMWLLFGTYVVVLGGLSLVAYPLWLMFRR
jgi:hypothetical protein